MNKAVPFRQTEYIVGAGSMDDSCKSSSIARFSPCWLTLPGQTQIFFHHAHYVKTDYVILPTCQFNLFKYLSTSKAKKKADESLRTDGFQGKREMKHNGCVSSKWSNACMYLCAFAYVPLKGSQDLCVNVSERVAKKSSQKTHMKDSYCLEHFLPNPCLP